MTNDRDLVCIDLILNTSHTEISVWQNCSLTIFCQNFTGISHKLLKNRLVCTHLSGFIMQNPNMAMKIEIKKEKKKKKKNELCPL